MFKSIKEYLSTITSDLIKDYIKSKIVYLLLLIFAWGGNMITENTVGWTLILISSLIGIYLLKNVIQEITKNFTSIQQDISYLCSVAKDIQQFTKIDKKLLPFDTRLRIVDN